MGGLLVGQKRVCNNIKCEFLFFFLSFFPDPERIVISAALHSCSNRTPHSINCNYEIGVHNARRRKVDAPRTSH